MLFNSFFGFKRLSSVAQNAAKAGLNGCFDFLKKKKLPDDALWNNDEKAFAFFKTLSPAETLFLEYAAAFPEIFGTAFCRAAVRFFLLPRVDEPSLTADVLPADIYADHVGLLKEFYGVARRLDKRNKSNSAVTFIENYERFASLVLDLRFEGAALERLKDAFCEDDRLSVAEPNWIGTSESVLTTENLPPARSLFSADEQTARVLADILTLCAFRDGAFPVFDPNEWRLTENGELFLKKCSRFIIFSPSERRFLNGFISAVEKQNFPEAAKILFQNKTLPPFFPMSELSKLLEKSCRDPLSRTDALFKNLYDAGVDLPPSFFLLRLSLKSFETFVKDVLRVENDLWVKAADSFKEWIGVEPKEEFSPAADFLDKGAEMPELYALSRRVRGKKMTNFVKDKKQIPEMIKRAEAGYRFRPRPSGIGLNILIPLLALGFLTAAIAFFK